MALQKLLSVEENTAPPIIITLQRNDVAIDLSNVNTVELIITLNGTVINAGHQTASITTPTSGIVSYTSNKNYFTDSGTYICEAKITYGDNTVERVYEKFEIKARPKLG